MTDIEMALKGEPATLTRRAWLGLGGLAVLLAGCGRKGDLYLPQGARKPAKPGEETPPGRPPTDTVPEDFYDQ